MSAAGPSSQIPTTRPHRVVVTAGHVDHGKSTLVRALTGMEPDRLDAERQRGLTIELGYVWTTLATAGGAPEVTVAFVDVPGHERFVTTMLAGAGPAPAALLVVAADDGVSAQTREHRDVLALLELPAVAVVITKADRVDAHRIDEVADDVGDLVEGTTLAGAPLVVTDAVTGRGLDQLRDVLRHRLGADRALPAPIDRSRPRLWVDRVFTVEGRGTVVTGTLDGGSLAATDEVVVPRARRSIAVRGIQSLGHTVGRAAPGNRVALALRGVDRDALRRGDAITTDPAWLPTEVADLWLRVLDDHRVTRTGAWRLHVGSAATSVRIMTPTGPLDGPTTGIVRVRLDRPLVLTAGDGVILREVGRQATVAGGRVADPYPHGPARYAAEAPRRDHLEAAVRATSPHDTVRALVRAAGGARPATPLLAAIGPLHAVTSAEHGSDGHVRDDREDDVVAVGAWLVDAGTLRHWTAAVRSLGAGPHDRGAIAAAARGAGAPGSPAAALATYLVARGELVRTGDGYADRVAAGQVDAARARRVAALLALLDQQPFDPPALDVAARAAGVSRADVAALVASGTVVRVGGIALTRNTIDVAIDRLTALTRATPRFTAAEAKTAWGTSRRVAIPLLEYLDRIGVTRFDGQHRELVSSDP